jgi:hypothetical protein
MPASRFSHRPQRHLRSLQALDFGLRVRVEARREQRTIFSGAENFSASQLTSELAELVSALRVRSYTLRAQLEEVTSALLVNVECGFWPLARRAAQDLGDLLLQARKRHLADAELCYRGAHCAFCIADLCGREVR